MTIDTEVLALRKLAMLTDLDRAPLKLVAMMSDLVAFRAGDTVFERGEAPDAAYIVLEGVIKVVMDTPEATVILSRHSGGILIGEVGILLGRPRTVTIVAETALSALRLAAADFLELVRKTPDIAFAVMRELARQIDTNNRQFAQRLTEEVTDACRGMG